MTDHEKRTLRQMGVQRQQEIARINQPYIVSLDRLENLIQQDNIEGAVRELIRLTEYADAIIRFNNP